METNSQILWGCIWELYL